MLEVVTPCNRFLRTIHGTKAAECAGSQVVQILVERLLGLTILQGDLFADHLDGAVRAIHLTNSASGTFVFVRVVVRHLQFSSESLSIYLYAAVLWILLGNWLSDEVNHRDAHTLQKVPNAGK